MVAESTYVATREPITTASGQAELNLRETAFGRGEKTDSLHFRASRNAGFVAADSDFALIIRAAAFESLAHDGMSPQRISDNCRTGSFGCWRITGTGCVCPMLYRGT